MNGNYGWKSNYKVPAFGNWDYEYEVDADADELPYTQCFESARQTGMIRYGSYPQPSKERDLYVAGDLYQDDIVTPAFIVVPPPSTVRKGGLGYSNVKEQKREWEGYSYSYDKSTNIKIKEAPSPILSPPVKSKAVDQDLYKIPSEFLHVKSKRKRSALGFFSSCLLPACL